MRILLAIDGSKFSDAAVQAVIAEGQPRDAEVRVPHVVETPTLLVTREMGGYDLALDRAWEVERQQAQELVEKTVELLRVKGLEVSGPAEDGNPQSKILEAAKDWRTDLIVFGSHRRKGLEHFVIGSVSEAVARHAHCACLVQAPWSVCAFC
jgi:nucleotide-binding universal stress UspA family protein